MSEDVKETTGTKTTRKALFVTTAETIRQPRGAFAALSSRSYRIYIGGQSLANTGTWMQSIAQDWLIFSLTHSSTAVGVTMALQFLPMLLLGLHAGRGGRPAAEAAHPADHADAERRRHRGAGRDHHRRRGTARPTCTCSRC